MTIDMYGEKVAEASALIREFAKVDYFHYFARDPESSLEEFIAMLDQAEEKGRQSQAARVAELERQLVEASAPAVEQQGKEAIPKDKWVVGRREVWFTKTRPRRSTGMYGGYEWACNNCDWSPGPSDVPHHHCVNCGETLATTASDGAAIWRVEVETTSYGYRRISEERFVSAAAPQAADTDKVREAIKYSAGLRIAIENAASGYGEFIDAGLAETIGKEVVTFLNFTMAAQAPVREVPEGWIACADQMPESGKRVIFAWTNKLGKHRASIGQWNKRWDQVANNSDEDACEYDEDKDEYFLLEGWQEWGWELEFSAYVEDTVTHWMPLPAAPVQQEGAIPASNKDASMSTTDTRAAFEEWAESGNGSYTDAWAAWQAATEAAKPQEGDIPPPRYSYSADGKTVTLENYDDMMEGLRLYRAEAAKATGTAGEQMSKTEIDAIVYKCRQRGNDTTYDIVNACLAARQPAQVVAVKTWRDRKEEYHLEVKEAQPDAVFMALEIEDLRAALAHKKKEA